MPVVVPVMMVVTVMMMPVMMVVMMVVPMARTPHRAAVRVTGAPVMVADPEPRDIVDHIRLADRRLHRRRRHGCGIGV